MIGWENMQRAWFRRTRLVLVACALGIFVGSFLADTGGGVRAAWAADGWKENAKLLLEAKDFRVRVQAALSLGTSGEKEAVTALCKGLGDENRTVRIAAASALGRLALGGKGCLQRRLEVEPEASVKTSIERALAQLEGGGAGGAEPAIDAKTKFYVAIDKLAGPERLNGPVRAAFVRGAKGQSAVAFAPVGEKQADAERVLAKFAGARGFAMSVKASKPSYADGTLEMKLSVALMSYPDRNILLSFSQKAAMGGVTEPNPKAEEELLVSAAEAAMQKFLGLAPTLE